MANRPSYALVTNRPSFNHERLKLAENSIRLFQVQRGAKTDQICLVITQFSSIRRPPYRAISYTWGSSSNLRDIVVNGRAFKIHYNLWSLLFNLRQRNETGHLWADALCIDQANLRERNFHVQLMGRIYQEAKSVIVWLGIPKPDRTEIRALEFIEETMAYHSTHGNTAFAQAYLKADVQHRWATLLRLCRHLYWTRTWIVQEFLRAPEVEVVTGTKSINWNDFEKMLLILQTSPYNQHDTIAQILQSRPARLTLRRRARGASTLHDLLGEYHDSMCTERSDKVYGILGLASDCGEDEETGQFRGMVPDYNKTVVEIYLDAVACIERSLIDRPLLPSVANLVRRTLQLDETEMVSFINKNINSLTNLPRLKVLPDYVGVVDATLPSWSSVADLKSKLMSTQWGQYVGYEMRSSAPGVGKRSSTRAFHTALADDMISNVINVAETEPEISFLNNYPMDHGMVIPLSHLALHPEDKRLHENPDLRKPMIIIEQNSPVCTIRLGLACSNTRRGDYILQFRGLDTTVICRQVGRDVVLVGKAVMVRHSQVELEHKLDPICTASPWLCPCPCSHNEGHLELETDALSLAELLTKR